jgi:murein DD-endopeptidase MepM/ murein hydrolase activator NlpD
VTARAWLGVVLAILASALGAASWLRCEKKRPEVNGPERVFVGRSDTPVAVEAMDVDSGIRTIELRVEQGELRTRVAQMVRPGNLGMGGARGAVERMEGVLNAEQLGLREGDALLIVKAEDWSWRRWFDGNSGWLQIPLTVDLTKPRIAIETGQTYVERGGAGAVVYSVKEETQRDGVQVGDAFFTGHPFPRDPKRRVALFAIPRDVAPSPRVAVIAVDLAGNEGSASWPVALDEREFDDVRIELSNTFLQVKVRDLAEAVGVKEEDELTAFRKINSEIRAQNEQTIRELVAKSSDEPLFQGPFLQMRNSAVTSRFAERRSYYVEDVKVSEAIHYGYDLASTAGAPIEASNRGRVLFAGELGIYGNSVLLDHGLGLVSLYAHLSQIAVAEGDLVEKGVMLGRSGDTGLAGGDHLHFAMLIGDAYVDPTEWWDAKWVDEKVLSRLGGAMAVATETPKPETTTP